jgi:hypothetical protein
LPVAHRLSDNSIGKLKSNKNDVSFIYISFGSAKSVVLSVHSLPFHYCLNWCNKCVAIESCFISPTSYEWCL